MARVPAFKTWWSEQQQKMSRDEGMRFFLELRNYSQKEGRISLVGVRCGAGSCSRWSHRFAGTDNRVPAVLLHRDVVDCCVEHIAKLAKVVLDCTERFPFHTCPRMALSRKGVRKLGLSIQDLAGALGFDTRWADAAAGIPLEQQLRVLQDHVDGLDTMKLKQLARRRQGSRNKSHEADPFGEELCRAIVDQLEDKRTVSAPNVAGELLLRSWTGSRR